MYGNPLNTVVSMDMGGGLVNMQKGHHGISLYSDFELVQQISCLEGLNYAVVVSKVNLISRHIQFIICTDIQSIY